MEVRNKKLEVNKKVVEVAMVRMYINKKMERLRWRYLYSVSR